MASGSVKVKGLRELQRDLRKSNKDVAKVVRSELKKVGEVVAVDARQRIGKYDSRSAAGVRTSVRSKGVFVQQGRRKVNGKRPDFGSLQMRKGFIPALAENRDQVVEGLEQAIDSLAAFKGK